jgi:hypothetical protein
MFGASRDLDFRKFSATDVAEVSQSIITVGGLAPILMLLGNPSTYT